MYKSIAHSTFRNTDASSGIFSVVKFLTVILCGLSEKQNKHQLGQKWRLYYRKSTLFMVPSVNDSVNITSNSHFVDRLAPSKVS